MAEFHLSMFNVFQRKSTSPLTQHMPIHSISELFLKVNDPDATDATVWPGEATSRDVTKGRVFHRTQNSQKAPNLKSKSLNQFLMVNAIIM